MNDVSRHIVHIVGTLNPGGVQRYILDLERTLPRTLYRHSVVCLHSDAGTFRQAFLEHGFTVSFVPLRWPAYGYWPSYRLGKAVRDTLGFTLPFRLARCLARLRPAIVHTHITSRIHSQARAIQGICAVPWVWTVHGLYSPRGKEAAQWRKALRRSTERSTRVVAVSNAVAKDIIASLGVPVASLRVVYPGTDVDSMKAQPTAGSASRRTWGVGPFDIVFGSIGRLHWKKGFDLFVRAAQIVAARNPRARFIVAGEGPEHAELIRLVGDCGLDGKFRFVGATTTVPEVLSGFDVFVMPSRTESFGLSLLEALAAGLPCIATEVGGIPEVFSRESGILVKSESHIALADAMDAMALAEVRRAYSQSGPRTAKNFSIHSSAANIGRLYEELLESPGPVN